jgi:hypothetical protein
MMIGQSSKFEAYATPSISFSSSSGVQGTDVTLTGSGFAPSSAVKFSFGPFGGDVFGFTAVPETATDSTGSFSWDYTIPVLSAGTYTVSATDIYGNTASTQITVLTSSAGLILSPRHGYGGDSVGLYVNISPAPTSGYLVLLDGAFVGTVPDPGSTGFQISSSESVGTHTFSIEYLNGFDTAGNPIYSTAASDTFEVK